MSFESRVVLDGSQTQNHPFLSCPSFESRVVLDGSQTWASAKVRPIAFESRVVLDGSQTDQEQRKSIGGLRVVLF